MTGLQGRELVTHVFARASGRDAAAGHRYLIDLWHRCCDRFGLHDAVAGFRRDPPADLADPAASSGVLAARSAPGPEVRGILLRRLREVLALSVVLAPGGGAPGGWPELEYEWSQVLRPPTRGVVGAVRILQARLADPAAALDPVALGPVLAAGVGSGGGWAAGGVLRGAAPSGPFAVWEADPPGTPADPDTRIERRIVVVAEANRDEQLSAWTWTRGTPELTPFAQYLLHAAKVRYQLRVRSAGAGRELRDPVDAAIASMLRLTEQVAATGRPPEVRELTAASANLVRLQAGELGLVDTASRLREALRTVEIAGRNMSAYAGPEVPTGLFADDADLVAWASRQLDNDATYLESALERARSVSTLADQLVSRGVQNRRERFELALTGVIGAVLMVLAAMQSLQLEFDLPKPLLGGVVTGLGALALLVPLVVLRLAVPDRRWPAVLVCLAIGLLAATVPWIVLTAVGAPSLAAVVGWSAGAAATGIGLTALYFRSRAS